MDPIEPLHTEDESDFDAAPRGFDDSAPRPVGSTPLEEAILSRLDEDKAQDIVLIDLKGKSAMADAMIGILSGMARVTRERMSAWEGRMSDRPGFSSTSSNV